MAPLFGLVEPDLEFVDVVPVRVSRMTVRAPYAVRVECAAGSVHLVCLPVESGPGTSLHAGSGVGEIAMPGVGGPGCEGGPGWCGSSPAEWSVLEGTAGMDDGDFVQNLQEELARREACLVNAEEVAKGDKIQDQGWLKVVQRVTVLGERVALDFEHNPYSLVASYQTGHPALVYRVVDDADA